METKWAGMLFRMLFALSLSYNLFFCCSSAEEKVQEAMDYLCVLFGCEILKIVPGRVSTEV